MDGLRYTGAASTMGAALRQGWHTARAMLEKGWQAMNRVPGLSRCPEKSKNYVAMDQYQHPLVMTNRY